MLVHRACVSCSSARAACSRASSSVASAAGAAAPSPQRGAAAPAQRAPPPMGARAPLPARPGGPPPRPGGVAPSAVAATAAPRAPPPRAPPAGAAARGPPPSPPPPPAAAGSGAPAAAVAGASAVSAAAFGPANTTRLPEGGPPLLDAFEAYKRRDGDPVADLSALDANPYGWDDEARAAREAPLWMLYEAERQEVRLTPAGGVGAAGAAAIARGEVVRERSTATITVPMRDELGRAYATGGRKTASARVWVALGDGTMTVNGRPFVSYFKRLSHRRATLEPLIAVQACGAFDVTATVSGGGLSGQAGALRHGIARALARYDPQLRPTLRSFDLLERDPRMVERKKPGQAKARKKFQWVRR